LKPSRAYLDWAAGAPLHPAAREAIERVLSLGVGNPSSIHAEGRAARAVLEEARSRVAALAGCQPAEVVFTSSGSEANALAILGSGAERLFVGSLEHASARLAAQVARERGAIVEDLPGGTDGRYDLDAAARILGAVAERGSGLKADSTAPPAPRTAPADTHQRPGADAGARPGLRLVVAQLTNNETGALQPVEELASIARDLGAELHVDAVQAAGKVELAPVWERCRSMALSAHKLGGIAGAGALCLRRGTALTPRIPGHQERGLRGGTHSLAAIAAFGAVADLAAREREARAARLAELASRLESILRAADGRVRIQAAGAPRVPGIVSATFPGADGETLLVALDLAGVATAHGAACSTGAMEPSHVLLAMGVPAELARATLRFSVGPDTREEELDLLERALPDALRAAHLG